VFSRNSFPLRQKHRETFARAAGLRNSLIGSSWQRVAALVQGSDEFRRAFRQNNIVLEHNRVAGKTNCLFWRNVD
jgi:hypothetical protein